MHAKNDLNQEMLIPRIEITVDIVSKKVDILEEKMGEMEDKATEKYPRLQQQQQQKFERKSTKLKANQVSSKCINGLSEDPKYLRLSKMLPYVGAN